jgi:hypothetical protein
MSFQKEKKMANCKTRLLIAALVGLFSINAHSTLIDFNFTGMVNQLDSTLITDFSLGDSISGSYKVDDVSFVATDLKVNIGDSYFLTATNGSVTVSPGVWFIVSFSGLASGINGAPVNGSPPLYFDIQLDDDNNLLSSGVLPLHYSIPDFGWDRSNINFPDDLNRLDFEVQSIEVSTIPIPGSAWLFAIGIMGMTRIRKIQA